MVSVVVDDGNYKTGRASSSPESLDRANFPKYLDQLLL